MGSTHSTRAAGAPQDGDVVRDDAIEATEHAGETQAIRNLFDLRVIIGGLFTLYGIYLTIHGLLDSQAAVDKAAGVRINLWSGIGMLVVAAAFLLWAKLRPLTFDRIVESQADSIDTEVETDEINRERAQFTTAEHRARERAGHGDGARATRR